MKMIGSVLFWLATPFRVAIATLVFVVLIAMGEHPNIDWEKVITGSLDEAIYP
jgi:hypothetical protein